MIQCSVYFKRKLVKGALFKGVSHIICSSAVFLVSEHVTALKNYASCTRSCGLIWIPKEFADLLGVIHPQEIWKRN